MRKWVLTFSLLALCLPPGVPPLDELRAAGGAVLSIEGQRESEHFMVVRQMYVAEDGRAWNVFRLLGAVALVDDHPEDDAAMGWWIDPGLLTDDVPPKVQAAPVSTCQFRRRGEST